MRILAVNHLHPAVPHIGGTRVRAFAEALSRAGHQVVLLTQTLDGTESSLLPTGLAAALDAHDWSMPLHLACKPAAAPWLSRLRDGSLPRPLRMAIIAALYLGRGGVFDDWTRGSRPYWPALAERFQPDVAWATFGNTDAWRIAQGVARLVDAPWVMDIKDSWDAFIPWPLRGAVARRFRDAAWATGLSESYLTGSGRWFPMQKTPIYSGFPAWLVEPFPPSMPFRLTITGSVYQALPIMVAGIRTMWDRLGPAAEGLVVTYMGADHARVGKALSGLGIAMDIRGYLPLDEVAAVQREAFVNLYAKALSGPDIFQHKVFELLCAGRPMAVVPGENPEALGLVSRMGGQLHTCGDPAALAETLETAWQSRRAAPLAIDRNCLAGFAWDSQAKRLEQVLLDVVERRI